MQLHKILIHCILLNKVKMKLKFFYYIENLSSTSQAQANKITIIIQTTKYIGIISGSSGITTIKGRRTTKAERKDKIINE